MNIKKLFTKKHNFSDSELAPEFVHLLGLPAMVADLHRDTVLDCNQLFQRLTGATAPFSSRASTFFPDQRPKLIAFSQAVEMTDGAVTADLLIDTADAPMQCILHGSKLPHPERLICLFVVLSDALLEETKTMTSATQSWRAGLLEWKRLESMYKQAESINELVLQAAGDGIFGIDRDGNTTFMNPAAEATLGWSEQDLIGQNMHELIHHHHSSGEPYQHTECPIYRAFRHGVVERVDNEVFWHKSGQPVPVEYTSTPIYTEGQVQGAVIVFRDISERIATQNALADAIQEVDSLKQRLQQENEYLRQEVRAVGNHTNLIGSSPAIAKIIEQIEIVATTNANVLITGESGTGKELVAQGIHDASLRKDQPLIRVNCAAIPKDLFESEFFGHVKGAFSGAVSERIGRFELANGGTLFLDEVGEIPIDLQGKLLRVLQERKYERVGEGISRETDVRIIAATNRDLRKEVEKGTFREDLYFRLDVFPIHCAPLRERIEDIPVLAAHFAELARSRFNIARPRIDATAIRALQNYPWPGNARELQNVIERGSILAKGGNLVFEPVTPSRHDEVTNFTHNDVATEITSLDDIARLETKLILETLARCQGRVSGPFGAARALGLKPTTLYSKLKRIEGAR